MKVLRTHLPTSHPQRAMAIMQDMDCIDDAWFSVDLTTEQIHISVNCNDLFYWASADSEPITADDVALLEQTARDLEALGDDNDTYPFLNLLELYAARRRNMQPLPAYVGKLESQRLKDLFRQLPSNDTPHKYGSWRT